MVQISTHVQDALDRLMEQYRNKPRISAILTSLVDQIQDLEDVVFEVRDGTMLFNGTTYPAIGAQLDQIGEIVGQKRNGLEDAQYLLFILGKIAANYSDASLPTILKIIKIIYQPESVFIRNVYPNAIAYSLGNPALDPLFFNLARTLIQGALGQTVDISYIATHDPDDAFRFTYRGGPLIGGGFADKSVPGSGGKFADSIYTNPNQ